ncbi:MAG: ATP-binding cassette domain-containing protein [Peptococcia bacterium]
MIELQNVTKVYKTGKKSVVALDNVSLHIPKGVVYGIIGLSGAGKSSLLRMINMLERPTEGKIIINGEDITQYNNKQLQDLRKKIGMIFQHFNLLSSRTVEENIALPLEIAGFSKSEIKERVSEIIPLVGLEDKQYNYVGTLSGGQKQRVGIARALANRPQLLLCDEATSALDPQNTAAILELLKDINKKLGLTIVLITHEMEVVKKVSDHVSFMADGKILESNSVIGIMSNPKHPLLRSFLQNDEDKLANFIKEQKHMIDPGALLVRLIFIGEITREAVLAEIIRSCQIEVNILQGQVDSINDTPIGDLIVELRGAKEDQEKALAMLKAKGVEYEVEQC